MDFPLHPVDSLQLDLIDCRLLWSISIPINHSWKRLRRSFPVLDCLTEINLGIIASGVWVGVANWGSTLPCLLFLDVQSTSSVNCLFFFFFLDKVRAGCYRSVGGNVCTQVCGRWCVHAIVSLIAGFLQSRICAFAVFVGECEHTYGWFSQG